MLHWYLVAHYLRLLSRADQILRFPIITLVTCFVLSLAILGLRLRQWAWDSTVSVRFVGDMQRNFMYGRRAVNEGYLNVYENVFAEREPSNYDIDYPPVRLLTFSIWVRVLRLEGFNPTHWDSSYRFNAPLLYFNTFTEAASAIGAFLLVRCWTRKSSHSGLDRENWGSWIRASLAAMLIWFSPGVLVGGHAWVSYDV